VKKINKEQDTGHGRKASSETCQQGDKCAASLALHLVELATAFARSFVRRWLAEGGREIDASAFEELAAIFHAHFVTAWARCGIAVSGKRELFREWFALFGGKPDSLAAMLRGVRSGGLYGRALLGWLRAYNKARGQVRSHLWGKGAERYEGASLFDLQELARAFSRKRDKEQATTGQAWATLARKASAENIGWFGRVESGLLGAIYGAHVPGMESARLRRHIRHARWCLRAFWLVGAGQRWHSSYVSDCEILQQAATVARGGGLVALDSTYLRSEPAKRQGKRRREVEFAVSRKLCDRVRLLRVRLAAGDLLLTEQPERVAAAFMAFLGVRRGGAIARNVCGQLSRGVGRRGAAMVEEIRRNGDTLSERVERIAMAATAARVRAQESAQRSAIVAKPGRRIVAIAPAVAVSGVRCPSQWFAECAETRPLLADWRDMRGNAASVGDLLRNVRAMSGNVSKRSKIRVAGEVRPLTFGEVVRRLHRVRRVERRDRANRAGFGWIVGGSTGERMTGREFTRERIAASNRAAVEAMRRD
jgi:hypothetical protein